MRIVYDSKTGSVKRFVQKLHVNGIQITNGLVMEGPYVLITYTTGFGQVPPTTERFLEHNAAWLRGVVSSGNQNWGLNYGRAADAIALKYDVPLLMKFELSGTKNDVQKLLQEVHRIVDTHTEMDPTEQRNYDPKGWAVSVP